MLLKHRKVFALDGEKLGVAFLVTHSIDTGDAKPVSKQPFRVPIAQIKLIADEINKMLADNVISPSKRAWSAPIFPVKKKDETWRPVIDFRGLNAVTKDDIYPKPPHS